MAPLLYRLAELLQQPELHYGRKQERNSALRLRSKWQDVKTIRTEQYKLPSLAVRNGMNRWMDGLEGGIMKRAIRVLWR